VNREMRRCSGRGGVAVDGVLWGGGVVVEWIIGGNQGN
jgi:hypothetical protein